MSEREAAMQDCERAAHALRCRLPDSPANVSISADMLAKIIQTLDRAALALSPDKAD